MKIRTVVTVIGLLMFNVAFGQSQEKYSEFAKEALKRASAKFPCTCKIRTTAIAEGVKISNDSPAA